MNRKEWAWAAVCLLAFWVTGIVAQVAVPLVLGSPVGRWPELIRHSLLSPWIAPIWVCLAGASIATLRRAMFGRVANFGNAVLVLALGAAIDAAYEFALTAWSANRLVIFGPPVFHDGLLAVAVAAFAALVALPRGRLIASAALLVADGWALSGLAPSTMFYPPDSLALRWLPIAGVLYLAAVTVLVLRPLVANGVWRPGRRDPSPQAGVR